MLEAIDGTAKIGGDRIARAISVTRMYARFRSAFDEEIGGADGFQVLSATYVPVVELDALCPQSLDRQLAAASLQVVEGNHLPIRMIAAERAGEARSDEPGTTRYQQAEGH